MRRYSTILLSVAAMIGASNAFAAITAPDPMPSGTQVACPHPYTPGYTKTLNMSWTGLSGIQSYLDVMNTAAVKGQFTGDWSYVAGSSNVNGTLSVGSYAPYDNNAHWPPDCTHGCSITLSVAGLANLPAGQQFQWLQYFNESGNSGSRTNTIDPPSTASGEDNLPFYYHDGETNWGTTSFGDGPDDWMPDATIHSGGVSFVSLLTSWDGTAPTPTSGTETVNVYGAVTWGYEYACIPEPTTLGLLGLGVFSMGMIRRRK